MTNPPFDYSTGEVPDCELPVMEAVPEHRLPWELRNAPPTMRSVAGRTDMSNAQRLVHRHDESIRFIGTWQKWLTFNGRFWELDDTARLQALAKDVAERLVKSLNIDSKPHEFSFAKYSSNARALEAMVKLARDEVAIRHNELNPDPLLLNVQNGTVDLRTGAKRPHDRNDLITKESPVTFDANAACPEWNQFLNVIFDGNSELFAYVQQLCGYFLTGCTNFHLLPVLYGTGANGKTTFLNVVAGLLGEDYASKAPKELLVGGKEHKTIYADLYGRRLAYSEETGQGDKLSESTVKDLTGGGRIKARRMKEDFWEFQPTHKLLLSTNHRPEITGTDIGIWRRVKLIPFNVTIPPEEQDPDLGDKLASELPGILNWAIEGWLSAQREGLTEPSIVEAATEGYRAESDEIGMFIADHCIEGTSYIVSATSLWEAYRDAGYRATQTQFGKLIKKRPGITKESPNHGRYRKRVCYRGIGLISEMDD